MTNWPGFFRNRYAKPIVLAALFICLAVFSGGCFPNRGLHPKPAGERPSKTPVPGPALKVGHPWTNLAQRLQRSGFSPSALNGFFHSPNLHYDHRPMEMKLREIYPLFYKPEVTREVQQKLYQLGYEPGGFDGRAGSNTQKAIKSYQRDHKLAETGRVTDALLAHINKTMKQKSAALRPLSSYKPAPPAKPSRPSTYKQMTAPQALEEIKNFYLADRELFKRAERKHGVPGEVIAGILWVETSFGRNMGRNKAASMLASMAAGMDFEIIEARLSDLAVDRDSRNWLKQTSFERGSWALKELEALLRYAEVNNLNATELPGSIYGAIGWGQFMPSNALRYGDDGDGDGKIDLFNKADAVFSTGRYLKEHGWRGSMTEEGRRKAIMSYNKSGLYVNTVLFVADHLAVETMTR